MSRRTWTAAVALPLLAAAAIRAEDPSALLFGTVFRSSYMALPGAKVVAWAEANPRKKYRTVTNYRGEYRIRVPAGDAVYVVSASAPKHLQAQRTVEAWGIEKSTANFILQPRNRKIRPDEKNSSKRR